MSATTLTLRRKSRAAFKCLRFGTFCTAVAFLYASEANAQCAAKDVLQNVAAPRIATVVTPSTNAASRSFSSPGGPLSLAATLFTVHAIGVRPPGLPLFGARAVAPFPPAAMRVRCRQQPLQRPARDTGERAPPGRAQPEPCPEQVPDAPIARPVLRRSVPPPD